MVECSMVPLPPFFSEVTAVTSGLAFHSCSPALPPSRNGYKKHLGKDVLNTLVIGTILQTICHIYVYIFSVYTYIYIWWTSGPWWTSKMVMSSGWWFGSFFIFSIIYGMSSFQLTFIFFRGVETTNQSYMWVKYNDLTVLPHWNHG